MTTLGYVKCPGAQRYLPKKRTLGALREAAAQCRGCATVHPSAVLRDRSGRRGEAYRAFVDDLRMAAP